MNELIKSLFESGIGKTIYDVLFVAGFFSVLIYVIWYGLKLNIKVWQSLVIVLIVYPVAVAWMFILFWAFSGFKHFGGNNIVRIFVYIPIVAYPVTKFLKISWKDTCCLLSCAALAQHGVSHWGCMFVGCCYGYPTSWGLFNPAMGDVRFPIQPIEAAAAILIIVYLLYRAKKKNYIPDGYEYPLMLILFGYSRFIFEFLRDNEKLVLGISELAFHALFAGVVGTAWFIWVKKKEKKQKEQESQLAEIAE